GLSLAKSFSCSRLVSGESQGLGKSAETGRPDTEEIGVAEMRLCLPEGSGRSGNPSLSKCYPTQGCCPCSVCLVASEAEGCLVLKPGDVFGFAQAATHQVGEEQRTDGPVHRAPHLVSSTKHGIQTPLSDPDRLVSPSAQG